MLWALRRIAEIINQHNWELTALLISVLGVAHGLAVLFAPGVWPPLWEAAAPPMFTGLSVLLFGLVLLDRATAARYTLIALACFLGWQAYFLLYSGGHVAGFLVAGAASFGAGLASLAAE